MAPVAIDNTTERAPAESNLKTKEVTFNPFYSPNIVDDGNDNYEFSRYRVGLIQSSSSQPCRYSAIS
jgi:hypothetical protein